MALRAFYNEIKALKVKELPAHLKPYFTVSYVKNTGKRWVDNYHAKYIETDSADPIYHICFGGMAFSYLIALPEERRHLAHQQEHGGGHWSGAVSGIRRSPKLYLHLIRFRSILFDWVAICC